MYVEFKQFVFIVCFSLSPLYSVKKGNLLNKICYFFSFMQFQLDKQQFEETVQTLNNLYAEAEKLGGKSYLEGCLACLTAYTIFLCMETHYEKVNAPQSSKQLDCFFIPILIKCCFTYCTFFKYLDFLMSRC